MTALRAPIGMLAELTHRCPLACPYCSNPLALERRDSELSTQSWARLFREAAELGVLQVHLSGGEPLARQDIVALTAAAHDSGLYTNLITSAVGLDGRRLAALREAGLDHVQISLQDAGAASADHIGGYAGGHARKLAAARAVVEAGMALTINAVIHRANIARVAEMVAIAAGLGAGRVEIAHAQYYGWALKNRAALMPTRAQVDAAVITLAALRERYAGVLVIDAVIPDYYARRPKPCMGGWGSRSLNITPSGRALPCHAAETIPGLEFWNAGEHSLRDIWLHSPAFTAFRGTDWMVEPCRSCPQALVDFGGCRCQAMAIAGDARAADPACALSPWHGDLLALAEADSASGIAEYAYRGRQAAIPIPVR